MIHNAKANVVSLTDMIDMEKTNDKVRPNAPYGYYSQSKLSSASSEESTLTTISSKGLPLRKGTFSSMENCTSDEFTQGSQSQSTQWTQISCRPNYPIQGGIRKNKYATLYEKLTPNKEEINPNPKPSIDGFNVVSLEWRKVERKLENIEAIGTKSVEFLSQISNDLQRLVSQIEILSQQNQENASFNKQLLQSFEKNILKSTQLKEQDTGDWENNDDMQDELFGTTTAMSLISTARAKSKRKKSKCI